MSKNNNCLDGMRCPKCRSMGPYKIVATALFELFDEGSEGVQGDITWDAGAYGNVWGCA